MRKNIELSDDVSHRLKRQKDDGRVSELIERRLDRSRRLADVTGQQILDPETNERVAEEINQLGDGIVDHSPDETR